jgi:ribonuclease HIII
MTADKLHKAFEHISSILKANDFDISDFKSIDYGIQFKVSIHDWSGIIRIYQNKKGILRTDYSQIKNGEHSQKIIDLIDRDQSEIKPVGKTGENDRFVFPIIGTDESGKGDYFGPLVSAGVYVDTDSSKLLEFEGVRDSKKLSDNKVQELANKIAEICKGKYAVIEISPEKYNDLYDQFILEKKNLNTLLAWGHAKAIEEVLSKVECKTAMADQFADERFIKSKLQERGRQINLIQMHKAEQNIAVAAASVLARARFLEKLSRLSVDYKVTLSKGVSAAVINSAKKIVAEYGEEGLRKVAKLHFKTTQKVLSL